MMDWNSWLVVAENLGLARLRVSAYLNFLMILFDRVTITFMRKVPKSFYKVGSYRFNTFQYNHHSYRNSKLTQKFKNESKIWNKIPITFSCLLGFEISS